MFFLQAVGTPLASQTVDLEQIQSAEAEHITADVNAGCLTTVTSQQIVSFFNILHNIHCGPEKLSPFFISL